MLLTRRLQKVGLLPRSSRAIITSPRKFTRCLSSTSSDHQSASKPTVRVGEILRDMRPASFIIPENASLDDAVNHLVNEKKSASLAVNEKGDITGIFTARDLLRVMNNIQVSSSSPNVAQKTRLSTKVKDFMAPKEKLVYCSPLDSVRSCREIMFQVKIRNIPVIENGVCLGIINIKNLADSAFSVTDVGGKKGFIHNVSNRRGIPEGTRSADRQDVVSDSAAFKNIRREVVTGSYSLPHPFKGETGVGANRRNYGPGELCMDHSLCEDAHFALNVVGRDLDSPQHSYLCVADGVGSWRSFGVDPRLFSHKLVENAKISIEMDASNRAALIGTQHAGGKLTGLFDQNPVHSLDVLVDAFQMTLHDNVVGSSTVCVAHIDPEKMQLSYSNLGDGGLMVVRHIDSEKAGYMRERQLPRHKRTNDLRIAYLSQQQLKSFNRPYQLGYSTFPEHAGNFQLPIEADSASIPIMEGDIVLVASDGLFDNMDLDEIVQEISTWEKKWYPASHHGLSSGHTPGTEHHDRAHHDKAMASLAKHLVEKSRQLSLDNSRDSPFAILAKENDIMWGGGMPDDTTIVVARVSRAHTDKSPDKS